MISIYVHINVHKYTCIHSKKLFFARGKKCQLSYFMPQLLMNRKQVIKNKVFVYCICLEIICLFVGEGRQIRLVKCSFSFL